MIVSVWGLSRRRTCLTLGKSQRCLGKCEQASLTVSVTTVAKVLL